MPSRLILTLATLATLAACTNDMPAAEPGVAVTGKAEMGVVVGGDEATEVQN